MPYNANYAMAIQNAIGGPMLRGLARHGSFTNREPVFNFSNAPLHDTNVYDAVTL
jgi:hypothetical protein